MEHFKFVKVVISGQIQELNYWVFSGDTYLGRYDYKNFVTKQEEISIALIKAIVEFEQSAHTNILEIFDANQNKWVFHSQLKTTAEWMNARIVLRNQSDIWRIVAWSNQEKV